jgi:hypothetical protein
MQPMNKVTNITIWLMIAVFLWQPSHAYQPDSGQNDHPYDQLKYRALNYVLEPEDHALIEQILLDHKSVPNTDINHFPATLFVLVLKHNHLPLHALKSINEYAGFLEQNGHHSDSIRDIRWWSHARQLQGNKASQFFHQELKTERFDDVVSLMAERGLVDPLRQLMLNPELSEIQKLSVKFACRRAEVMSALEDRSADLYVYLSNAFSDRIHSYFSSLLKPGQFHKTEHRFINEDLVWMLKQLGVHRNKPAVNSILLELSANVFHFNQVELKELISANGVSDQKWFFDFANERLELDGRVKTAINPHKKINDISTLD